MPLQNIGYVDRRFGSGDRNYLTPPKDIDMRVPDEVRKSVLFVGVQGDLPEWEWKGTGYLIAVPQPRRLFENVSEHMGRAYFTKTSYPFMFLATARHVAEKLEGKEFALRTNRLDGTIEIIRGPADQKWWYHPTEREYVDAAVAIFSPANLEELDLFWIDIGMFVDESIIHEAALGVGDDVFMTGLFTKVTETSGNVPIVRIGNLAMMPNEKIPFKDGKLIDAYLVESRSVGGLSGSPVFIRQTIRMEGYTASGRFFDSHHNRLPDNQVVVISGLGRTYFLGSAIGHWDTPTSFPLSMSEAVNMGISPIVPAHKIKEIITQPELGAVLEKVAEEMAARKHSGAVYDFDSKPKEEPTFTREDFEAALKKVTRKKSDKK